MNIPTGIVTFLFTDIEGRTKLAQEFPNKLTAALEKHHSIMYKAIESNNGYVFKTIGDAFCCAFENAADAVKAAVDANNNLSKVEWDEIDIKVRMGIHTGTAEWNGTDFMGYITLSRTSRIMSSAYGQQIIISSDAYELAKEKFNVTNQEIRNASYMGEIAFRDLGERRLKDVIQPIRLFQIVSHGLREDFPPLKTLDVRPHNLPIQLTSFIGREEVMKEVKNLFIRTRLLSIIGSGGAGKTRLAMQVGADLIDEFENGVFIAELAALSGPSLILQTIINSIGVKEETGKSLEDILTDYLNNKKMLLILDNCEHLINECAAITESLLSKCPDLKIMATSRESLNCIGEQTFRIPSLSLPETTVNITPDKLNQYESVRLFIDRALSVNANFRVTNNNASVLAEICSRLDGIPLAIELAAARTKVLTLEKIYERLGDRFNLLTGGKRTALPRQQTLRALIDWSYDLLSLHEQILWGRLSIFSGGWTLEAAKEICTDDKITKSKILNLLIHLSEKSIIIYDEDKDRYRILETLKQYGEEKLKDANETENVLSKHLHYYMEISETSEPKLKGSEIQVWLEKLEADNNNFQSAIEWSIRGGDKEEGVRLAGAIGFFWQVRGQYSTGKRLLESILDNAHAVSGNSEAKLLNRLGSIVMYMGEYGQSQKFFEMSLALSREIEYKIGIADSLHYLGNIASRKSNYEQAQKYQEESLALRREAADKYGISSSLLSMGSMEYNRGNYEEAQKFFEESLVLQREIGDKPGISYSLNNLGSIAGHLGNYEPANKFLEESLELQKEMGYKHGIAGSLVNLGSIAGYLGNYELANKFLEESLQLQREMGNKPGIAVSLNNLGLIATHLGNYELANKFLLESISIYRELENKIGIVGTLLNLGTSEIRLGNYEQAKKFLEESLLLGRELGDKVDIATSLNLLGRIAYYQQNYETARKFYEESLTMSVATGEKIYIIESLTGLSAIFSEGNEVSLAVLLLGALETASKSTGFTSENTEQELQEKILKGLHEKLSDEEFSKYYEEGKKLTLEQVWSMINVK